MKTRVEPSNDFVMRKMPVAERLARQKAQEARLTGVHFSPETTPAHGVVDRLVENRRASLPPTGEVPVESPRDTVSEG